MHWFSVVALFVKKQQEQRLFFTRKFSQSLFQESHLDSSSYFQCHFPGHLTYLHCFASVAAKISGITLIMLTLNLSVVLGATHMSSFLMLICFPPLQSKVSKPMQCSISSEKCHSKMAGNCSFLPISADVPVSVILSFFFSLNEQIRVCKREGKNHNVLQCQLLKIKASWIQTFPFISQSRLPFHKDLILLSLFLHL